ncbi:MAG: hypothetical protein HOO96_00970 [Polyangiaceae bacterium]|nr:hypothetical protein [Polyangiaceae bacterium]
MGAPGTSRSRTARARAVARFFVRQGLGSLLVRISLGLSAVIVLAAMSVAALVSSSHVPGELPTVALVPGVAARAIAWGGGILVAFALAQRAFHRDISDGVVSLLRARGLDPMYLWGRVGAAMALVGAPVVGGTLLVSVTAVLAATRTGDAWDAVRGGAAALVYSALFTAVLVPLSLAALGGRTRGGGYFFLLLFLVIPEMVSPLTRAFVPEEMTSIPHALQGLSHAMTVGHLDLRRTTGSVFFLTAVALTTLLYVRREAQRVRSEAR